MSQRKRPPNWEKIRAAYEAGEGSHRQLADRFGVAYPTLRDRAKRESWSVSRSKIRSEVISKTSQAIAERAVQKNLSDLEVLDGMITKAYALLDQVEPKSFEAVMNAINRAVEVKAKLINPDGDKATNTPTITINYTDTSTD